jgi:UDP-glucose 4-epimerase
MVIVIGKDGFIGKSILSYLNSILKPDQFIGVNRSNFEVIERIDLNRQEVLTIIFCVGNRLQYHKTGEIFSQLENEKNLISQTISKTKYDNTNIVYFSSAGTLYKQQQGIPSVESSTIEPNNNYGFYKMEMENYLSGVFKDREMSIFLLRVSNVYGPFQKSNLGQGLISTLVSNLLNNKRSVVRFGGEEMRDYIYIDDLCSAVYSIISRNHSYQNYIYNISSGSSVSTNFIIDKVYNVMNSHSFNRSRDLVFYTDSFMDELPTNSFIDCSSFMLKFGWKPKVDLDFGIGKVLDYQVKHNFL